MDSHKGGRKGKKKAASKDAKPSSSAGHSKSGGKGKQANKKGGGPRKTESDNGSRKDIVVDRKRELKNRPQIFLTPETKAAIRFTLDRVKTKEFEQEKEGSRQSDSAKDFQKRYASNLEANSVKASDSTVPSNESGANSSVRSRDPNLDRTLKAELKRKCEDGRYQHMQNYRRTLPAYECSVDVVETVKRNQIVVICGETGSGKTTQVCQFILDDCINRDEGSMCNILCAQPRRISAISVAERVAEERGENVGNSIGYSVRLESRLPSKSAATVLFVTTGVVLQYLKADPDLKRFSVIIVDEVHEREVLTDFLLAILKDLVKRRPDLKVLLMSATLNAKKFSDYFYKCPVFTIPGLTYPVTEYYLEDVITKTKFLFQSSRPNIPNNGMKSRQRPNPKNLEFEKFILPFVRKLDETKAYPRETTRQLLKQETEEMNLDLVQSLIEHICISDSKDNGAILVFMPSWDTISSLLRNLQGCGKFPYSKYVLIPLHSLVPAINQREVFQKPPPGKRKIIVSTNIAELSITIDDVVHVIDTGKVKVNNFDLKKNMETLDLEWISLANAKQRKGRAGRVREGYCYHLFTKARESQLEDFKKPEVLRRRLEEVMLQMKMLKLGGCAAFLNKLMDQPDEKAVQLGIDRLISLHALDMEENLTPLGFHLAHVPMDPQTGKMILMGAIFSCVDPVFSIAASLTFKDAFYIPMGRERKVDEVRKELSRGSKSDHIVTVKAIEGFEKAKAKGTERDYCYRNFISQSNVRMLLNLKAQFAAYLFNMKFLPSVDYKNEEINRHSSSDGLVTAIAAAGLYPNVAKVGMKGKNSNLVITTEEDGVVHIHPKSINARERTFECPFLVYHQKMKSSMIFLYDTTMVSPFPLIFFGGTLQWVKEKGYGGTLVIDNDRIRFGCMDSDVFKIVDSLRGELDKLLQYKVNNPGPTVWGDLSKEGALLKAITQLISVEYKMLLNVDSSDDDCTDTDEE